MDTPESSEDKALFGALCIQEGLITREQLELALEDQIVIQGRGMKVPIGDILISKGLITREERNRILRRGTVRVGETRTIAGFEVMAKLGAGAMGVVYKARKVDTGHAVALKILPVERSSDAQYVDRFLREMKALGRLDHSNIVKCVDAGFDAQADTYYCALEFIEGETLSARLEREGFIQETPALEIVMQVAQALQHAHHSKLVHRDVKPANIMITPDGTAKLCDFGLARQIVDIEASMTHVGTFVGSPLYSSPEQVRAEPHIDSRSDVYSLGATFYHMITGEAPYMGENSSEVMAKHLNEDIPWPADINPDVSDNTCLLIEKMMAKSARDRYQAPKELLADIVRVMEGRPPSKRAAPGRSPLKHLPEGRRRRMTGLRPLSRNERRATTGPRAPVRTDRKSTTGPNAPVRDDRHSATRIATPARGRGMVLWQKYALYGGGALVVVVMAVFFMSGPDPTPPAPRQSNLRYEPPKGWSTRPVRQPRPAGWQPLFDGVSLGVFRLDGEGAWSVQDGVLVKNTGSSPANQVSRIFSDGDIRVRFDVSGADYLSFAVRQGVQGSYFVAFNKYELGTLGRDRHEIVFHMAGDSVTAELDGRPAHVTARGAPADGNFQVSSKYGDMRIYSIEFRPLSTSGDADVRPVAPPSLPAARAVPAASWQTIFDGRSTDGWTIHGGTEILVSDSAIVLPSSTDLYYRAAWEEFAVEFECRLEHPLHREPSGALSLAHTAPGRGNGRIYVRFHGDGDVHVGTAADYVWRSGPDAFPPNQWFAIRVELTRTSIKIYRDGKFSGAADVSAFPVRKGGIYFYSGRRADRMLIRNVRVKDLSSR
ncbi:MAG: protein kinase [Planctomycetes bacterium]|nr:protein kinase [Planctomycetota bacterium]